MPNVTPWPQQRPALAKKRCRRGAVSPQTKSRIEAELGARLGDRDHAVIIRDVVDASRAAREREQRRVRRGIDVQRRSADGLVVPGAWSIKKAIAQDDAIEAG